MNLHLIRSRSRLRAVFLLMLLVLSVALVGLASAGTASGEGQSAKLSALRAGRADQLDQTRPSQAVAYARIALVRVLAYYIGSSANSGPVPVQTACAADGVLVGTVGGTNSFSYVLAPSAALSPVLPCQGVQAAFSELYGTASNWTLQRVDVLLSAAYTGTREPQLGSIRFTINPSNILTDGGPAAPPVLALPLSVPSGAPTHDLPLLTVPQASDAPATGASVALDLVGNDGQLLGRDSLQAAEVSSTLYPLDLSATSLGPADRAATATPQAPQQGATGGTVLPGSAPATASTAATSSLAQQLSLGAPIIDSNGRLVGMVVRDSAGEHTIATTAELTTAIGPINIRAGALMSTWQEGIAAYYSSPPNYTAASTAFAKLADADPDFAGLQPFAAAAQQHTQVVAPLLGTPTATPTPQAPSLLTGRGELLLILAAGAILLLVVAGVVLMLLMRRRQPQGTPIEEQGLDLLPREMMYGVPPPEPVLVGSIAGAKADVADAPTQQITAVRPPSADTVANQATVHLQTVRPAPAVSRTIRTLVPRAAGASDSGLKRIGEPNQDAILAITGTRVAGGRTQPYALLAVADGMGGHNNGREASILAIGALARTVLPVLTSQQPLDNAAVDALVREAIQRGHDELRQQNVATSVDMGTTITSALVLDDQAFVFNVGDSRTYVLNPDAGLRQITRDHSIVASLVASGVIRPEDIYHHPRRNQIYRSLGGEEDTIDVDSFLVPLQAGDKILLCSDGLWEMVRDPQLEHILRAAADPHYAAQLLMREANTNGGEDNIGIVIARMIEEVPKPGATSLQVVTIPSEAHVPGLS